MAYLTRGGICIKLAVDEDKLVTLLFELVYRPHHLTLKDLTACAQSMETEDSHFAATIIL